MKMRRSPSCSDICRDKEIIFFVMSLSQPRCIKRVISFKNAGFHCIVYGYRRGIYDVNAFPDDIQVHDFGQVKNRDYKNNFGQIRRDISYVIHNHGRAALYYSFGFAPSLFFALKKIPFIYECSDVWYAYPKFNNIRWILKYLDKCLIKKSKITVMTSEGFSRFFGVEDFEKVIVLPNRVSPYLCELKRYCNTTSNEIAFGFVGSIRYINVFRFAEIIGKYFPHFSFHFYGGAGRAQINRVQELVSLYPNVLYHGTFKSPEDLPKIYDNIDVIVACYDNASINEQIAEPNKLYESLFFCKPIIVSPNTYLAERVKQLNCGFVVDASEEQCVYDFINTITASSINKVSKSELALPIEEIIDTPTLLINRVESLFF